MIEYNPQQFGDTVMRDFRARRLLGDRSITASVDAALETKALGHPAFEDLAVGERRTASLTAFFWT
jgi:adenylate cyclase